MIFTEAMNRLQKVKAPSIEADQALHEGLDLLPLQMARMIHEKDVTAIAVSSDGKYLAAASDDRTTRVWKTSSGQKIGRITHEKGDRDVAFSLNGKYVITAGSDQTARKWLRWPDLSRPLLAIF